MASAVLEGFLLPGKHLENILPEILENVCIELRCMPWSKTVCTDITPLPRLQNAASFPLLFECQCEASSHD